jgi:REP element-mobilizing transposase RayT
VSRELRVFDPEWIYHVVAKGNNGESIVRDDLDRRMFVGRFSRVAIAYEWESFAWCLMGNHAHWLLRAPVGAISAGMQELLSGHARGINGRHGRVGHLFRNRFFARPLKDDSHVVASVAYVDRNPLKHGACQQLAIWRDSSYRAHMGLETAPPWLLVDETLGFFGADPAAARENLAGLVYSGHVRVSDTITEVQRFEEGLPVPPVIAYDSLATSG